MGSSEIETKRPRVRLMIAAVAIPLVATLVSAILLAGWRDELPDQVATHWGPGGEPDGFMSVSGLTWSLVVGGIVLTVLAAVAAALCREYTLCVSIVSGVAALAAFVPALALSATGQQLGVADATSVGLPWWSLVVALAVGAVSGVLAHRLVPKWTSPADVSSSTIPMTIEPTERVVWTRSVLSGGIPLVLMVSGVLMCVAVALLSGQWLFVILAAVLALVAVLLYGMRVTVGPQGLTVRSIAGWPRMTTPASEIAAVRAVKVSALKDFGGYGYRFGFRGDVKGAKGFVLKSGDGILVDRIDGSRQIVVVDDADTGVRLLEAYRLRAHDAA
jgi:uncharacterized membrane protein